MKFPLFSTHPEYSLPQIGPVVGFGTNIYYLNDTVKGVSIPTFMMTLADSNFLHATMDGELYFNLDSFYIDFLQGLSLRYYPFSKYLDFHINCLMSMGICFWNNYGHIIKLGMNWDIPIKNEHNMYLGFDYNYKMYVGLLNYYGNNSFYENFEAFSLSIGYKIVN